MCTVKDDLKTISYHFLFAQALIIPLLPDEGKNCTTSCSLCSPATSKSIYRTEPIGTERSLGTLIIYIVKK